MASLSSALKFIVSAGFWSRDHAEREVPSSLQNTSLPVPICLATGGWRWPSSCLLKGDLEAPGSIYPKHWLDWAVQGQGTPRGVAESTPRRQSLDQMGPFLFLCSPSPVGSLNREPPQTVNRPQALQAQREDLPALSRHLLGDLRQGVPLACSSVRGKELVRKTFYTITAEWWLCKKMPIPFRNTGYTEMKEPQIWDLL